MNQFSTNIGLGIILSLILIIYLYFTWNFGYWKRRGVPYLTPTLFFGDFKDVILLKKTVAEQLTSIYNKFQGSGFGGFFISNEPVLLIRDPEIISEVLIKNFESFTDRHGSLDPVADPFFGKGTFLEKCVKWKESRPKFSLAFTPGKLKKMNYSLIECGKLLIEELEKFANPNEPIEMKETFTRFTCDTIAACAFGVQGNCLKNDGDSVFREMSRKIFTRSLTRISTQIGMFFYPKIMKLLRVPFIPKDVTHIFRSMVREMMLMREEGGIVRDDYFNYLMRLGKKRKSVENGNIGYQSIIGPTGDNSISTNEDELFAQAMSFYVAGTEMAANVLIFALYELSVLHDVQDKLADEIDAVLEKYDGIISYDAIQEMSYLDMVVTETMRKYPVQTFLDRNCTRDFTIPGTSVVVEKGTAIYISIYGIHHDPQYYPDPEKFDPERFTEENKKTRPKYTYLPFGEGPRKCVASRFGLQQVKAGLAHILSNHEIRPHNEIQGPVVMSTKSVLLSMKDKFYVQVKKRNAAVKNLLMTKQK